MNLLTCGRRDEPGFFAATRVAVRSLLASDLSALPHRIVVVDNGSEDATPDWVEAQGLEVVRLPENVGIPRARNVATRLLFDDPAVWAVAEVHNDMVFPRGWLHPLVAVLEERPRVGIASSSLLTQRGTVGSPKVPILYGWPYEEIVAIVEAAAAEARRDWVRLGLQHPCLKRRAMLDEIGLYDEAYGMGNFEDTDEVYRAAKAGWEYVVVGASVAWHHYWLSRTTLDPAYGRSYNENFARFLEGRPDARMFLANYEGQIERLYAPEAAPV